MATIVQPYNPWREQLALTALGNVAGSIIGDIWKTHRDNQQNRKINAFRGQLNQDLRDNVSQGQGVSLVPQNLPEGYNSDPWANAFHKTDNPITQFDLGTAGLAQNTQRTPSIRDIMQGVDRLAATPRFSMLGADTVNKIRDDLLQGAYADMFANAGNIGDQMTALAMGAAHGKVPYQVLNAYGTWGAHNTPHHTPQIVNSGNRNVVLDFNPQNGAYREAAVIPMGINPTQKYLADSGAMVNMERNAIMNRELDVRENQNLWERENPPLTSFTDASGNVWNVNTRTGQFTPAIDDEGYQIAGDTGKNPALTAAIRTIDTEMKGLDDRAKEIRSLYKVPMIGLEGQALEDMKAQMNRELAPIVARQQELANLREAYVSQFFPQNRQRRKPVQTTPTTTQPTTTQNTSSVMALGESSPDVRPQIQPITTPPANTQRQPRPTERNMREFTVSDDFAYDPIRDKNIEQSRIYTAEHFRKFIKSLQEDPRFSRYSTEQLIDYAYKLGIRIRQ